VKESIERERELVGEQISKKSSIRIDLCEKYSPSNEKSKISQSSRT
jgi:hypothetical protein